MAKEDMLKTLPEENTPYTIVLKTERFTPEQQTTSYSPYLGAMGLQYVFQTKRSPVAIGASFSMFTSKPEGNDPTILVRRPFISPFFASAQSLIWYCVIIRPPNATAVRARKMYLTR
jgi:hypothetical protein